jgi:hypothetical protein
MGYNARTDVLRDAVEDDGVHVGDLSGPLGKRIVLAHVGGAGKR